MIAVQRLAHATLQTPDMERALAYFTEVNGLTLVARSGGTAFVANAMGQVTIALEAGTQAHCAALAFEVAEGDLGDAARVLRDHGVSSEMRGDPMPGTPQSLRFTDPAGTRIELFAQQTFAPSKSGGGVNPLKLGHVARFVADIPTMVDFYTTVLGFRVSDWIGDYFVFLRCNADHHAVNFFRGEQTKLHHMAFELKDMAHIQASCDVLAAARIPIGWGPLRQSAGHNIAVYHRSTDGHSVEYYCELDQMKSEALGYFDPRPWHNDRPQRPKVWAHGTWEAGWGTPPAPHFGRTKQGADVSP